MNFPGRPLQRLLVAGLLLSSGTAAAQDLATVDPGRIQLGREELVSLLRQYEQTEESTAYSAVFRDRVRGTADLIRERLEHGDFQIGDQVVLSVAGEPQLTAAFPVRPGRTILLPEIGEVSLQGVLRAELQEHLRGRLARYLHEPEVQATALLRVMVSGAVGRPGFYMTPAQALLSETIMTAGGFAANADLDQLRIVRDAETIWSGRELQQAIAEGQTLDQMSLRAGDHVVVAARAPGSRFASLQTFLLAIPPLILSITALQSLF